VRTAFETIADRAAMTAGINGAPAIDFRVGFA
jgi:hypothetical protein